MVPEIYEINAQIDFTPTNDMTKSCQRSVVTCCSGPADSSIHTGQLMDFASDTCHPGFGLRRITNDGLPSGLPEALGPRAVRCQACQHHIPMTPAEGLQ